MHTRSEVLAKLGGGWHRGCAEESCMDDRELAAQSEVPKTMPQRIADLLREPHQRPARPGSSAFDRRQWA
jgi:hypothetical protein